MAVAELTLSSKNYSSWSLRGWLLCRLAGLKVEERIIAIDDPENRAELLLLSPSVLVPRLTHEGASVWDTLAIAEYLHELGPKTLFATHYHHLNELEGQLPRVKNYRIAVKEDGEHIIFLRRIIRGGTDRSFGIQVARLAGLPTPVIARANELLETFAQERLRGDLAAGEPSAVSMQAPTANLFEQAENTPAPPHPVLETLRNIDVENLTPLEAIIKLQELKKAAT